MALMGQMMSMPLLISSLIQHAARHTGDTEIVSKRCEGDLHRYTWRDAELRSRQLAQALARLGCEAGDRIGTLAWNGHRHLEIYYGASGSGLVCHTINPRLFPEQIAWIVGDAQDKLLCFDLTFLPLVEKLQPLLGSVQHYVLMTDRAHMPGQTSIPNLLCFEELIAAETGHDYVWPQFDENTASSICYTSGTTGHPKGAVYSHRSTVLHAFASAMPDAMDCSAKDVILPVVPMFHVNAWGLPYSSAIVGAKLVFPGPHLDGKSLYELFENEGVTFSAGVPTVWLGLLTHVKSQGLKFSSFKRTVIGGSACPPAMLATLMDDYGVEVIHAWGMTELSPLGTLSKLNAKQLQLPQAEQRRILEKQGKVIYGIDMAVIDDEGRSQPWDGRSSGNLVVRGHWVIASYFRQQASPLLAVDGQPGWFPTGDVATIDGDGFMQITDRSKDVIKSGGEWISSIELENIAMAHPAVHEAAVIAVAHPKWDERPLLVVVKKPGAELSREAMLAHYEGRIAKWQIPDDVAFVDEIPHTATGKIQKLRLREQFKAHRLPGT
ncbi:3-(methylthio)propionyl-CoA ligase [Kinneretia asaccharophila]|uniref:Fatty-acyl-CoA synthase n=1 Tax=Roseateles asaccharophilus TaxID=582607 RepID=A0A4R6N7Z7_9BURK|nr:3-(methylthio)propionyl-CoA ligase [Roseateles asaccharophilus]MDN3546153.1 3-(methylthio)propionyl-CoA ligase [Roseateles asaccharophilus]TDP11116.1 fatty-acyl-CoA synthase [Roseateles asaccharophilus]